MHGARAARALGPAVAWGAGDRRGRLACRRIGSQLRRARHRAPDLGGRSRHASRAPRPGRGAIPGRFVGARARPGVTRPPPPRVVSRAPACRGAAC